MATITTQNMNKPINWNLVSHHSELFNNLVLENLETGPIASIDIWSCLIDALKVLQ